MTQRHVSGEDAQAVAARVRELLQQAKAVFLQAEKQEVAIKAEMDGTMDALRRSNRELQGLKKVVLACLPPACAYLPAHPHAPVHPPTAHQGAPS